MRTIGELIKEFRVKKHLSLANLERATKIKRDFIEAIEKQDWNKLPEFPVVIGFVKNIAQVLKIDQNQAVAFLRRDYPPKLLRINPKPDLSEKFTWSPRLTFLTGITLVAIILIVYLGFQYKNFISPPSLEVDSPQEGQLVEERKIFVSGVVDPDATVSVNNQPVLVGEDGKFVAELEIFEGTQEIVVIATSRSGKQSVVHRKIKPELD